MSIDPSLKARDALRRHRNVLTRAERIEVLREEERWQEKDSVFSLAKVAHRKVAASKKKGPAKEGEEGAEVPAAEGAAVPAEGAS